VIITSSAELQERELIKLASLADALAGTLRGRGVKDPAASLAAEIGIAVFHTAFGRWIDDANAADFPRLIHESLDQLKVLASGARPLVDVH
jgi:hypothetical protein